MHVFPDEVGVQIVERGIKIQFNSLSTDRRALLSERLEQAMMRSNSFLERDLLQQRGTYGKVGLRDNEKEELDENTYTGIVNSLELRLSENMRFFTNLDTTASSRH